VLAAPVLGVPEGVDGVDVVVVVEVSVFFVSVDVLEEDAVLSAGSAFLLAPLLL
jgi:hypothetical protein